MKRTLTCELCNFNFSAVYGSVGDGFIECHHTQPLATLRPGETTKLSDLALVCSNCLRMLHRSKTLVSIQQLKDIVQGQRATEV